MVEKPLSEKEWKVLPENKGKRYKFYRKQWFKEHREEEKEVQDVGVVEKIATVPQAIAEHMNPEAQKAVPFSLEAADEERRAHFSRAKDLLKKAREACAVADRGVIMGIIAEGYLEAYYAEVAARDSFKAIASDFTVAKKVVQLNEKEKQQMESAKKKADEIEAGIAAKEKEVA